MDKKLIEESLVDDSSFSSNTHVVESIVSEQKIVPSVTYSVPSRYYRSKLVLLSVNPHRYYIYWEITSSLLQRHNISSMNGLVFKVVDEHHNILTNIDCSGEVGEYFINEEYPKRVLHVELGYYDESNNFIEIMTSNSIKASEQKITYADKTNSVWMKKTKGFSEIIRSSMQHFALGVSSASYIEEIERLRSYENEALTNVSSNTLAKGESL